MFTKFPAFVAGNVAWNSRIRSVTHALTKFPPVVELRLKQCMHCNVYIAKSVHFYFQLLLNVHSTSKIRPRKMTPRFLAVEATSIFDIQALLNLNVVTICIFEPFSTAIQRFAMTTFRHCFDIVLLVGTMYLLTVFYRIMYLTPILFPHSNACLDGTDSTIQTRRIYSMLLSTRLLYFLIFIDCNSLISSRKQFSE